MAEGKGGDEKGGVGWKGGFKGAWAWGPPPGMAYGGKGVEWFKGAITPRTDGWGYQGVCWTCGKVGHKTAECTKRLQEVAGETGKNGDAEGFVDENALEVDKCWSLGCVDSCCSQLGVGGVRRKRDKKGEAVVDTQLGGISQRS